MGDHRRILDDNGQPEESPLSKRQRKRYVEELDGFRDEYHRLARIHFPQYAQSEEPSEQSMQLETKEAPSPSNQRKRERRKSRRAEKHTQP